MTIPASRIVQVNPGVLSAGGSPLALNGVMLSQSLYLPTGSYQAFASASAVSAFFGPASAEYAQAQIYFAGYDNSRIKPGSLIFFPYAAANRAAWLQSGSFAGVPLATVKAITGTLIVTCDGTLFTSSSLSLGSATSMTDIATAITAAFTGAGKPICTWDSVKSVFLLTSPTTGATSTMTFATGTASAAMLFTAATGAVLSQGQALDTISGALDKLKAATQNWGVVTTLWEMTLTDKQAAGAWASLQNSRYMVVVWDTDSNAIVSGNTANFGYIAKSQQYDGTIAVYNTLSLASFVLGMVASVDFTAQNNRITAAFKSQAGFTATVTDETIGENLLANGYNFYGAYATAQQGFNFFYNGQLPGKWKWLDPFIDEVYLNAQLQLALMTLLTSTPSIPYNDAGYNLIRAAMADPIFDAVDFGTIRRGVALSAAQIAAVNMAAGRDIGGTLQTSGWYLQVLDPGASVRAVRGSPIVNLWYTDGGAVQKITVASVDVM